MAMTAHMASPMAQSQGKVALPVRLFILAVVIPFAFGLGPLVMTGVRLILIALVVPMTVRLFSGKYGRLLPTDIFFFLHMLWAAVALGMNNPDRVVQNIGSTGIEFLGGYLLGRAYIRSREDMIALLRFLVIVICCTLPFAVIEAVTGRPLIIETLQKLPVIKFSPKNYTDIRMGLTRVQMAYFTPIHYGLFSMLGISFCYVGLQTVWSKKKRLIFTAMIIGCVFFSLSSGALLPMILQLFLIFWAAAFNKLKKPWALLFGLFALAYVGIDILSNRTPYRVFMTYATFSPGTAYWRAAINEAGMENIWANPVFGIGLNDWVRPAWMHSNSFDNFWLLMAMRYGILGFVTVASGYAFALWQIARRDLGEDQVLLQLRRSWVFTFGCLAFTLFTVHVWAEIYALVFFILGAGMWLLDASPSDGAVQTVASPRASAATTRFSTAARDKTHNDQTASAQRSSPGQPPRYTRFPPKK